MSRLAPAPSPRGSIARLLGETAEPLSGIADADLGALLERIGGTRVVLLGEATHGSAEFYRMRDRITRELIARKGFSLVAVEADWPDAAWVDRYVGHAVEAPSNPRILFKFAVTTGIATVLFAIAWWLIDSDLISFRER